jgi:hypothetical protein
MVTLLMLWQITLLLSLIAVNQATVAALIARKTTGGNTITLPLQRSYMDNERFKSMKKRSVDSSPLINQIVQVRNNFIQKLSQGFAKHRIFLFIVCCCHRRR